MNGYENVDFNKPVSLSDQKRILKMKADQCHKGNISSSGWCPEVWDEILCWQSTAPGELAILPCPSYITGFDVQANASRECMSDGQWFWNSSTNSTWSNYSQCYRNSLVTVVVALPGGEKNNGTLIKKFFPIVKTISKVGYTVSLFTLVIAFLILVVINLSQIGRRKLRCPRNMLHMHLFASFMLRAFMALMKDILFVSGIALASDVMIKNGNTYWLVDEKENSWLCKVFTSFWQYFILANYFWILMEGLYLHNLVFLALFTDINSSIIGYVCLGWGLPAVFVSCWIVARVTLDNKYCWTTHENSNLFLLIRVPTMLSILINFGLFVNIVRVLLLKLKSTVSEETQRYKRWAKSTLVLVPLFGVHYTVFLGMSYSIGVDETVEVVWLFCDQLFASFQGFFVAVLYCFLNGEVRTEVTKAIRSQKLPRFRTRWNSRPSTHSNSTCSCNASKLGRRSKRPRWWKEPWLCFLHDRTARRSTHSMILAREEVV
ncbi:parathyroid hormone/parathyroid hormone-related peptide receptor-like isoform X4 [Bombus vosnesenskii]|uniref:Parathyroid hormone/parathyroid hormone-related peptide receptor-like isoform X4 n=3 Tax=Pyrobombus TaxID=144703 RepID=A0A6J3LHB4_9HYME|nr:parathyroid hormone/parathyroid hormone-related peptide receptor-like isoform X4 [Bombus impatiens]XP_033185356.1 parathyroid hormone/parathyroid hormone-related peptide receptor-like isoform X4 [Bombus vancouverensis nearcticus]XP_033316083.1 parathyroid hormone/parathyroid hormone-related peptide receptor-like isoform X4 [Bombus bifarius]XP_033364938.1 parathyroid hormone/parathyroid hormone-related peptide receptor-like isoform X4 [Bombus vosnesenskii]XP_050493156.1 parathyroid hormone/pa